MMAEKGSTKTGMYVLGATATVCAAGALAYYYYSRTESSAAQAKVTERLREALRTNIDLFNARELSLVDALLAEGQAHLFASWPFLGSQDADKQRLVAQLLQLDSSYHGGITAYIRNAKKLLKDSKEGRNPFEGFTPSVPHGEKLDFASPDYIKMELSGLEQVAHSAFVLVAGGLGERLGYSGIKVALPAESASGTCFLELYIRCILALQTRSAAPKPLPLAIMTSDDTHARTLELLQAHAYFGMQEDQVTLIKQEKVACFIDNDAHLALEPKDPFQVQTKPHGHGDVHALLHSSGLAQAWHSSGFQWVCFFQDTNALVFRALVAALGVSAKHDYDMNSLAVPRKAKEAIGAIAKLTHASGRSLTINVEYNQLDPLLRSTVSPQGDVNDQSGWSPYPGNINQLILKLPSYVQQLERTGGVISEFVNPKYKDGSREAFKSSGRLECMMQDYPQALPSSASVGFTTVNQVWASYSPVKNSPADALAKFKEGNPTHSATTGELDIYKCNALILQQLAGAVLPAQQEVLTFNGMQVEAYPRVVLSPEFAPVLADVQAKVKVGSLTLRPGSVLILDGAGIQVEGPVEVDGALTVHVAPGAQVTLGKMAVKNKGWRWQALSDGSGMEEDQLRGFNVTKDQSRELRYDQPGQCTVADDN